MARAKRILTDAGFSDQQADAILKATSMVVVAYIRLLIVILAFCGDVAALLMLFS